ncbi:hypothetical protein Apa02nite_061720 [Actinoplanes palleronii]|uniref:Uncharacterized protein n=1 Tax=Actinoplanes palleronii TaxID=113570 RepID=A0ABQ4BHD7_9ACTN|nr:hypothetical protein Apa02nite_061720 [Actinoplanes palleronii]
MRGWVSGVCRGCGDTSGNQPTGSEWQRGGFGWCWRFLGFAEAVVSASRAGLNAA